MGAITSFFGYFLGASIMDMFGSLNPSKKRSLDSRLQPKLDPTHHRVNHDSETNKNVMSRLFYYTSFIMSRNPEPEYKDVSRSVIRSDKVSRAIEQSAREELDDLREAYDETLREEKVLPKLVKKHRRRAREMLERMKSCISSSLMRIAGWIMFKVLSKILTTIQFNKGQIEMLKKVRSSNRNPVIYLPVHRSHLDYILISFVLYMNNVKPPLVAAGDNLYIPFFGNLLRGLGAFFIRRKMDPKEGSKDHVYRAVLEEYMAENLKSGESLEFFLEGGRSRSGKLLIPKTGLLSVVVNTVIEGKINDVSIVPVGVSYDKLIEGNFVHEQLGKTKEAENFSLASKAIWTTLHSNYGSVRVDFCQPFSLKEYLRGVSDSIYSGNVVNRLQDHSLIPCGDHSLVPCEDHSLVPRGDHSVIPCGENVPDQSYKISPFANLSPQVSNISKCSPRKPCVACSAKAPGLRSIPSTASLYGLDSVVDGEKRKIIQDLGEHIIFDASQSSALMSTHLLSFLLLSKYRKGATMRQLVPAMNWLRDEVILRKKEIGFTGETADVIRYAYNLLGRDLVTTEVIQMARSSSISSNASVGSAPPSGQQRNGEQNEDTNRVKKIVLLKPATKLSHILELHYYSNSVASTFALDSILANSIFALFDVGLDSLDDFETNNNSIGRKALVRNCLDLANLMKYEFILAPPCSDIEMVINGTIDRLIAKGILKSNESSNTVLHKPYRNTYGFDDEDGDGLELGREIEELVTVCLDSDSMEQLHFYRSIISPFIESYWITASNLTALIHQTMDYENFVHHILDSAKDYLRRGTLVHQESVAIEPLKNSIAWFQNQKIIKRETVNGTSIVYLTESFDNESSINQVILNIEKFKK